MAAKRVARRALVALVALLVAGCAQGTGDEETDASFDGEASLSGELTVAGFGTDDEVAEARLASAEEAVGGDVEVNLIEGELDIQQFLSAVASGEPPSLINAERNQIGTFASRGAIIPLTDCIEGEGIDVDAFREPALDEVTLDGDVYAVPEFNQVQILQANSELMEQAGVTVEDLNGSDWDAVAEANQRMYRGSGERVEVIGFDSKLPEFLPLWVDGLGGALISEDARTAQLDTPEVIEALEFAVSIYDAQGGFGAVKALRDSADFFGEGNQFATDVLGAMPMEQWYINILQDVSPDVPMAFDTIRTQEGEPTAYATGAAWAIPKGSAEPEAACRFIRAITETDTWVAAAEARIEGLGDGGIFTGILTGNIEADEEIRALVEPSGSEKWDSAIEAVYLANDHTFSMPANPAGEEFEAAWQDGVNRVLNGQQSAEEAMAQAQEEAQQALDEAWEQWDE